MAQKITAEDMFDEIVDRAFTREARRVKLCMRGILPRPPWVEAILERLESSACGIVSEETLACLARECGCNDLGQADEVLRLMVESGEIERHGDKSFWYYRLGTGRSQLGGIW